RAQRSCCLDPDAQRRVGEISERYLFDVDDLEAVWVGSRPDGLLLCLVDGFVDHIVARGAVEWEDPVYLPAHRADRGADGIGDVEMIRPKDLADPRDTVRQEHAASANRDQRELAPGDLDTVDT